MPSWDVDLTIVKGDEQIDPGGRGGQQVGEGGWIKYPTSFYTAGQDTGGLWLKEWNAEDVWRRGLGESRFAGQGSRDRLAGWLAGWQAGLDGRCGNFFFLGRARN